ncbi:MAG: NUDIX domain-containing protein [Chloroflexi bacterium]|nr:NUDIX domain-containing protein [Chloroflexota bacterium]
MIGVNVAVFNEGKILLTQREDFRVWCLPGGHVDPYESFAQAAIREVREEVGLEVELVRLVGLYSRPGWSNGLYHLALFTARPIGGTLKPDPHEVVEVAYFDLDHLPEDLMIGQHQRILDAASGIGGSLTRNEPIIYPPDLPIPRKELYAARDQSGQSPAEFYTQRFSILETAPGVIEVEGNKCDDSGK